MVLIFEIILPPFFLETKNKKNCEAQFRKRQRKAQNKIFFGKNRASFLYFNCIEIFKNKDPALKSGTFSYFIWEWQRKWKNPNWYFLVGWTHLIYLTTIFLGEKPTQVFLDVRLDFTTDIGVSRTFSNIYNVVAWPFN